VYVFDALKVVDPVPLCIKPWFPANTTFTVPLCATNAVPVDVKVPLCTTPPLNVIVPEVLWPLVPKSNTPPVVVIAPLVERRLLPPLNTKDPALTVVPPVYVFDALKVVDPVPLCTKP